MPALWHVAGTGGVEPFGATHHFGVLQAMALGCVRARAGLLRSLVGSSETTDLMKVTTYTHTAPLMAYKEGGSGEWACRAWLGLRRPWDSV